MTIKNYPDRICAKRCEPTNLVVTPMLLLVLFITLTPPVLACELLNDEKSIDETVRAKMSDTDKVAADNESSLPLVCAAHLDFESKLKNGDNVTSDIDLQPIDGMIRQDIAEFCTKSDMGENVTFRQLLDAVNQTLTENPNLQKAEEVELDFGGYG